MKEAEWSLTDHVCIACFGRILGRKGEGRARIFRCSSCGAEAEGYGRTAGLAHPANCACGSRIGADPRTKHKGYDAGIRCVRNENILPECPAEIIAKG